MSPKNCCVRLFFQDYIIATHFWRAVLSIFFLNFKKYKTMLQGSFLEQPDLSTLLLCFNHFTGYILSRGSNTNCLCFKIISHQAPVYLSELLYLYTPSRQLRSSTDTRVFRIPSFRTKSCGQRSFSYLKPTHCFCPPFYLCQLF